MKRKGAFHKLVFHFNWATKNREMMLTPSVERCLFPYIVGKCRKLGYELHALNGAGDHLHVLVTLTPPTPVADVAKMLKGSSSHYINHECTLGQRLYWQDGYGVISVRSREIPSISEYIRLQKEHHRLDSLDEELEQTGN